MNIPAVQNRLVDYETTKHIYLQRVNQFYTQVKTWLGDQKYSFLTVPHIFKDEFGTYQGEKMVIKLKKKGTTLKKNFNQPLLAELTPMGASSLLGEGVIEVSGWLTMEPLAYLPKGGPTLTWSSGEKQPMLEGVYQDGWYLLRDPRTRQAQLMDEKSLFTLITLVSDYEF
jgi:hypothetical protein